MTPNNSITKERKPITSKWKMGEKERERERDPHNYQPAV